ncbi:MAG: RsmB/NOP family class I SAM-dependent RNA methyltransferase [Lentisphaerae bacterium]|jgi:16S rRNA (cytosine967-C5)-methyltransferase|nr:RsmB/NOP family class I SAM-dependent RNA methyltransferase [Lentisphaerota bacterium]
MKNSSQFNPLPEKVLRRHYELLRELLPDFYRLVVEEGRPADVLLNHHLRTHRELGARDRRFLSESLFSYFRWFGWTVPKLALDPVDACLVGAMLDSSEPHPSYRYIRTQSYLPMALTPIGNLSLTEKCMRINDWFREILGDEMLTPADLVPNGFIQVVEAESVLHCIECFQQRPPTWLRSRIDPQTFIDLLTEHQVSAQPHAGLRSAVCTDAGTNLDHKLGEKADTFCVQDISSQCVAQICAPRPCDEWWDCCAGAGGKSLHLMDLMQQKGKVFSSDIRGSALQELKNRAHRYGMRNIRTQRFNAASDTPFRKSFDGVLVDAPCSGWGTWGRNPDARWRTSDDEAVKCANRQLTILRNASWSVKPGGILVYAVCSLTRPETEEVVQEFLDTTLQFRLDPFANPLTGTMTDGQLQVWPWDGPGDAMFIARFKRSESGTIS